jgi:hypothetical protein
MKHLFAVARGLSAVYKIMLFSWLIYLLSMQFKYRREIVQGNRRLQRK